VASLSQGRTAAAQCGLFTHKSVPVIFEPPCIHTSANTLHCTETQKGWKHIALCYKRPIVGNVPFTAQTDRWKMSTGIIVLNANRARKSPRVFCPLLCCELQTASLAMG